VPPGTTPAPYRLDGLELASGIVIGSGTDLEPPQVPLAPTVRAAVEAVLLEALQRPPLVVLFSGGRDSSALLSTATALARAHSLPLPLPATMLFKADDRAAEGEWAERMVRYLGLQDWERHTVTDELDVVGPFARRVLGQFGPVYPVNAHLFLPFAPITQGGTMVTGLGGDELFSLRSWWSFARDLRAGRRMDIVRVLAGIPPRPIRRLVYPVAEPRLPWLDGPAQREVRRRLARVHAAAPRRWADMILTTWWKELDRAAIERTMRAVMACHDVDIVHPFTAPGVLAAAAKVHPRSGFPSRTEGMREVFGDILPDEVLSRSSKARFNGALFATFSRQFVHRWQGEGSEGLPIDRAALQRTWATEPVDARSLPLLQGLWCRSTGTGPAPAVSAA